MKVYVQDCFGASQQSKGSSVTDVELMEFAAKAAGMDVHRGDGWQTEMLFRAIPRPNSPLAANVEWNPLDDDGDALRLALALGLVVDCSRPSAGLPFYSHEFSELGVADTAGGVRRAIVRAAAAMAGVGKTPDKEASR